VKSLDGIDRGVAGARVHGVSTADGKGGCHAPISQCSPVPDPNQRRDQGTRQRDQDRSADNSRVRAWKSRLNGRAQLAYERRSQDKRRRGTNGRRENRRISVHSILRAFRDPRAFVLQKKRPREAAVMAVLG
jgi:hypothetical protein